MQTKNLLKLCIIAFTFFCLSCSLLKKPYLQGLPKEEISKLYSSDQFTKENYGDVSAIRLKEKKHIIFNKDKSTTEYTHLIVKILDPIRGKKRYGDLSKTYNKKYDHLETIVARTFDGKKFINVTDKEINEITPPEIVNASIYSDLIERVISFPAIKENSIIELILKKTSKKSPDKVVHGYKYLQDYDPIVYGEFKIFIKNSEKLIYDSTLTQKIKGNLKFTEQDQAYSWIFENIPRIEREPNMPANTMVFPCIYFTTLKSWEHLSSWFWKQYFENYKISEIIIKKAAELTKGAKNIEDKIKDIALFVSKDVKNVYLSLGKAGYNANPPETVLDNKYGDYRDKAILLIALLEASGIKSYPILAKSYRENFPKTVPSIKHFNSLIVAVPIENKNLFLNPLSNKSIYGFDYDGQSNEVLIIKPDGKFMFTKYEFPLEKNMAFYEYELSMDDKNLQGTLNVRLDGYYDQRTRESLQDMHKKEMDIFFNGTVNRFSRNAISTDYKISNLYDLSTPVTINQSFKIDNFIAKQGKLYVMNFLKNPYYFLDEIFMPTIPKRNFAFNFESPRYIVFNFSINIPDNIKPVFIPEMKKISTDLVDWEIKCENKESDHKILCKQLIGIKSNPIPVERFSEYKDIINQITKAENSLLIFEEG